MYLKAEELLEELFKLKIKGNLDGYFVEIEVEGNPSTYILLNKNIDSDNTDGVINIKAIERV